MSAEDSLDEDDHAESLVTSARLLRTADHEPPKSTERDTIDDRDKPLALSVYQPAAAPAALPVLFEEAAENCAQTASPANTAIVESTTNEETSAPIVTAAAAAADDEASSPKTTIGGIKKKKKARCRVRFADDVGARLHTERVIAEPTDLPPAIPAHVLQRHRRAAGLDDVADAAQPQSTWSVCFKQPASEYIRFRHKLETINVALENALIKNEAPRMVGTIKVANVSYEKRVFVRCTADAWATHSDYDTKFQVSASKVGGEEASARRA